MPLLCKDMVDVMNTNNSTLNDSSLSNYAFLYGVFPTAPSVGIYAVYYNTEIEVVSLPSDHYFYFFVISCILILLLLYVLCQVTSGMVICTFLSAPIMYVSAWLLTISRNDPEFVMNSLQNVSFHISIVSLVGLVSHSCTSYIKDTPVMTNLCRLIM